MCSHHDWTYGDQWAVANRIMCDFVHRRMIPERVASAPGEDDWWPSTEEVD